jgi:hypothetical protein
MLKWEGMYEEIRNECRILVVVYEVKKSLGRPGSRRDEGIKMDG